MNWFSKKPKAVQTPRPPLEPGEWLDDPTPVWNRIPVHNTMRGGPQAAAVGVPAYAEPQFDLSRTVVMPTDPNRLTLAMVLNTRVQVEADPGFLGDFRFLQNPPIVQNPVNYTAPVYPLEGITYRNSQINEQDYWALAQARVAMMLQSQK